MQPALCSIDLSFSANSSFRGYYLPQYPGTVRCRAIWHGTLPSSRLVAIPVKSSQGAVQTETRALGQPALEHTG